MFLDDDYKAYKEKDLISESIFLSEGTIFSRKISEKDNDLIYRTLSDFIKDLFETLKRKGFSKFINVNKGKDIGPFHFKSAQEVINKNYNKIKANKRGKYDVNILTVSLDDEKICKDIYEVSYELIKKYNSMLPEKPNVSIIPHYEERTNTNTASVSAGNDISVETSGSTSKKHYSFYIICQSDTFKIES